MQRGNDKHTFNDDLLANKGDRRAVHELYPTLEHALYHPELVAYFKKFNDRADSAKKMSRTWGKLSIVLGAAALVLAATEIVARFLIESHSSWCIVRFMIEYHFSLAIGGIAAACGILSVAIGGFGVLFGSRKQQWLHIRFMGERIRQFHFQSLIAQLPQILHRFFQWRLNSLFAFFCTRIFPADTRLPTPRLPLSMHRRSGRIYPNCAAVLRRAA